MEILKIDRRDATVKTERRVDDRDWKWMAEYVVEEFHRRKDKRKDREKEWEEIDRQIRMDPEVTFKKLPSGELDVKKKWMAELELPLQAQALEVMQSDIRRLMFAEGGGPWFKAHAEVTDEYLRAAEGGIRVLGDDNFIPSKINQDNADKIVEAFLLHWFAQYDHTSRFDIINAEALKYGVGVGRARMERKNVWITEARGVRTEKQLIPTIVPCSIKNLYLEAPKPTLHSSTVLGPAHIAHDYIKYESIAIAANKGSTDPDDEDGGWMPKQLKQVSPQKNGYVELLEMEGDIVIPRKTVRSVVIRGAIITVAVGGPSDSGTRAVIRFRFRKQPFSSYILFPYLLESADDAYPSSPLMKGRSVQVAATDATNRFLDSAMLRCLPPIGYDRNDMTFAAEGGPCIYPGAMWASTDPIIPYTQIGGDPSALAQAALQFVNLYAELTGVLPARLGVRTPSHTTAYAKNAELERGATRTIDYVSQSGNGPLVNWLHMAYAMGRDSLGKGKISFFIKEYGGYVELTKACLPEKAGFEWFGANGPQDRMQKAQMKVQSLELASKIDQLNIQLQNPPTIDYGAAIREILREGGWEHLDGILNAQVRNFGGASGGPAAAPGVPGAAGGNPGATVAALQNLTGGGAGGGARKMGL